ncbi:MULTISPECIES: ATP-binding protein [unclassified Paenibacillus]|uniref:ATP-binding protein n=1 Tax=unclassified Paenibacillus TaxID=185978 RepID=UPI0024062D79|nr:MULTISPECIES: ATP-binding protein [unclassified Paenibacillus]MDF9843329.1 signal transduction histidine kinase [Paenibacillus sp. PastF-2]MDF9849917.1 signal transduction histidine kinase [Paenibacillus sp. PastM-2]MDF9856625.1 signal transduction histidine kinase [Paenibacillus sp. PastF-1]MDH6481894.1 signal transduction histidine kinase [Paenibacillus sp. PastH-2]
MITIIEEIKDILLQISAAGSFLFVFQWWLDQGQMTRRNRRLPDDLSFLVIGCALSIVICTIFSSSLAGGVYLNLAVLPAFIGILYAPFRSGLSLAAFFLLSTALFSEPPGLSAIIINSGALLYPLLFGLARPFKQAKCLEKVILLWAALFPSMFFVVMVPHMEKIREAQTLTSDVILITAYLFVAVVTGGLLILCIETAWDKVLVKEKMEGLSERFMWESKKLEQVTDIVQLNIMSMNELGYITELNEFMLKLIRRHYPDYTRELILSRQAALLFSDSVDNQTYMQLKAVFFNKQRSNAKIKCGDYIYQIYTAPVQQGSGFPDGVVMIVQDVTEEEKIRTELDHAERLTLVGQMAAGITHEIRNPMAVVRGFLQLMREKSPGELDSYYQIVMDELDRANGIINDFLSLAQSRVSDKELVQLHHIIEELSPLLWADANLRGQSVELSTAPTLPLLRLNVREIKQLILNLARNGMEAMDAKGVLTLETRVNTGNIELVIRDTGSGIEQDKLANLFTPFFTTKNQGTGLGLPLCLSIVERHNGTIRVDSAAGEGTAITVTLPFEAAEENLAG